MIRTRRVRLASLVAKVGSLAVATSLANLIGYLLTAVAARWLGPEEFGAFGALLALIIVGNVAALASQANSARATARGEIVAPDVRSGVGLAAVVGGAIAGLSPVLASFLQLTSIVPALAAGAAIAALAAAAPALGIVQGHERFGALGFLVAVQAALRVAGGLVGMAVKPSAGGALTGIAIGFSVAGILAWLVARPPLRPAEPSGVRGSMRSTLASGAMLLGFVVLTNADVILARHVLSAEASGLYAAGSIFTKIAFWLPQFVPLVAFPALTDPRRRSGAVRLGLLAVFASGGVLVAGAAVLAGPAVAVVAGESYEKLTPWVAGFTALGALLAVAQLLVYAHLARGDRMTTAMIWGILLVYVAVVELTATSLGGVLFTALLAAALVVVWSLLRERRSARRAWPTTVAP